MPRAMLVYNPAAGRYPSWLLTERAAKVLEAGGWQIEMKKTQSGRQITALARKAAAESLDAFIVVGGDGSLNRAVAGLVGTQTALGVLPAGTSNVWAQELGLPGLTWTRLMALEESARRIAHAQVWQADVGLCNHKPFLLWAGVGLDAFVVHHIEPRTQLEKRFAVAHYAASAALNATAWHGMQLRVRTDGEIANGHFLLAVVSNIHLYAGGYAELSPHALLDDGTMDLWLFEGSSLEDIVQLVWELWSGRHLHSDRVHRLPFRQAVLESDSPLYIQTDGEPLKGSGHVKIEVRPRAMRVLVPEDTPRNLFRDPPRVAVGDLQ
jgi:YegS/Rv2252/BmrU family lipid kinase